MLPNVHLNYKNDSALIEGTALVSGYGRAPTRLEWTMLWQVTRFCCLSGMCFTCRAVGFQQEGTLASQNLSPLTCPLA